MQICLVSFIWKRFIGAALVRMVLADSEQIHTRRLWPDYVVMPLLSFCGGVSHHGANASSSNQNTGSVTPAWDISYPVYVGYALIIHWCILVLCMAWLRIKSSLVNEFAWFCVSFHLRVVLFAYLWGLKLYDEPRTLGYLAKRFWTKNDVVFISGLKKSQL